jgi:hypothetical protein
MIDTMPLTGHILSLLLHHHLATTEHLRELLDRDDHAACDLDDRLDTLHAQGLTARLLGAWQLTDDGVAVASAQLENTGLGPINRPCSRTALALTGLGLAFRRQHRTEYPRAPFQWDTQVVHHFRDRAGQHQHLEVDARLRTCRRTGAGLLALDALVVLWPAHRSDAAIADLLLAVARFAGGPAQVTDPWRRWYPRIPHLLLVAGHHGAGLEDLMDHLCRAAGAHRDLGDVLGRVPVAAASAEVLAREGTSGPVWLPPMGGVGQVWSELTCGKGVYKSGDGFAPQYSVPNG